eukprot:TRINITY_DN14055_c0_g1_i1.p1 TRINITY_DN14055_c0_g1~~TRINITY_DN14055_c0_g1_i1.p1  ORF type:complete len:118 (-),score=5.85 TRINITY_DN14055_c0_g1_i1:119-472(-)
MIETVKQIKKRRASRLSNISISPMPKQYRDYHLTPKSSKTARSKQIQQSRRRRYYSLNLSRAHQEISNEESKDSEESKQALICYKDEYYKLRDSYCLLENQMVDIKNDLHRETSKKC